MDNRFRQAPESIDKAKKSISEMSPWARYWAKQQRVPRDSHLVCFGQRVTYTFVIGNDVASIHYDRGRGKIFYKGHNIGNEPLEPWLVQLLTHFREVLANSEYADKYLDGYTALVEKKLHNK